MVPHILDILVVLPNKRAFHKLQIYHTTASTCARNSADNFLTLSQALPNGGLVSEHFLTTNEFGMSQARIPIGETEGDYSILAYHKLTDHRLTVGDSLTTT